MSAWQWVLKTAVTFSVEISLTNSVAAQKAYCARLLVIVLVHVVRLKCRGTAIAHCPLSNFFFADKLLHVRHCLRLGVKVNANVLLGIGFYI